MYDQTLKLVSSLPQIIGFVGAMMVVYAYYKCRSGQWDNKSLLADLTNMVGAVLLTISLLFNFNLGSFLIELFWLAISGTGIYSYVRTRHHKGKKTQQA